MRLFVGVEISARVAAAAAELTGLLRARAADLAPHSRITWMTHERLHVTVRFIGHVDDGTVAQIVEALRPALEVERFELTVAGAGVFPPKGPPRVVWAGFSTGRDQLSALERNVSDRLAAAGVERERRPFNPHLTLARVREARGLRANRLLEGLDGSVLGTTAVDAITLFESRPSPRGPQYLAICRTPLA
jgi:2'-5' RNA ligase